MIKNCNMLSQFKKANNIAEVQNGQENEVATVSFDQIHENYPFH